MSRVSKGLATVVGLSMAVTLAACGNGNTNTGSPSKQETAGAVKGGVLNMLGTSDVDYMDPNISYYSLGYLNLRMWSRQLFSYPAKPGDTTTAVPDVATELPTTQNGGISADGLTYTIKIRDDVMWNSSPQRAVTAADFVRGVKRTCNPYQPFGGIPDFQTLIQGYKTFCDGFAKVPSSSAKAMGDYIRTHDISGMTAPDATTVVFKLTHPATYFTDMLAMPAFSAAPVEWLAYKPASPELAAHLLSDGPYQVASWKPTKSLDYTRNPAWNPDSDPIRKAYVDEIKVDMTVTQDSEQQQLETGTASADMTYGVAPPTSQLPKLLATKDAKLTVGETSSSNPYIVFNTVSPNNKGALSKLPVRQALEYALNRKNLIQVLNGPDLNNTLTHVLPSNILGSTDIDLYKYDPKKAKDLLAQAGYPNGLTLKFLYRPSSDASVKAFQTAQQDLSKVGIKLKGVQSPDADFYTKYLQVPDVARRGVWDVSLAGWGADWYGNAALSFFSPLFSGKPSFPPVGSNFGLYNDPKTNALIDQASQAKTEDDAAKLWAQADKQVMEDAAFFPITNPKEARYHAAQVHNAIYMTVYQAFDPTNVWLASGKQGG